MIETWRWWVSIIWGWMATGSCDTIIMNFVLWGGSHPLAAIQETINLLSKSDTLI